MTIDIRNAFNTVRWDAIMKALEKMKVPPYLLRIIGSYLSEKFILVDGETVEVDGGVPQGSVLGSLLWLVFYDGLLRLRVPYGFHLVTYADDLALVGNAEDSCRLQIRANHALCEIVDWLEERSVTIAAENMEAIMLSGRKKYGEMYIQLERREVPSKNEEKYLVVNIYKHLRFGKHIEAMCNKANRTVLALKRLYPRMNGPTHSKQVLLAAVSQSVVLYAAPVWAHSMR